MPAKSLNNSFRVPPADAFAAFPASWYLFCAVDELRRGPSSRRILGRQLVAFRTESGRSVVMDAHCAHLGADLGCGSVVGETIRCPFHHWRYNADGVCVALPSGTEPPSFARLRSYPVMERHGYLFFFNGPEALFPLPFFLGEDAADFVAGKEFNYIADTTWYMNAAHAFDRQHFAAVHDRELTAPPVIDCPAPFARRNSYPAKVVGHTVFDRFLRGGAGRTVKITLTIWGGTFAVITADFERLRSGFLLIMEPLEDGRTFCRGIVMARRAPAPLRWLDPLRLWTRRLFTHGYLREEARQLRSTRYNPGGFGADDQDMIDYFHWVASLPQAARKDDDENIERRFEHRFEHDIDPAVHGRTGRVASSANAPDSASVPG